MKARFFIPLVSALIFTGIARSQTPDQPRPDGPFPPGPMPERLRHRLEELHRDGKHEEAEHLERHVREMWGHRRGDGQGMTHGNPPDVRGAEPRPPMPPASPGERAGHLAEAARHLHAAGIDVSPEMLEKLGHRSDGQMRRAPISPGPAGERRGMVEGRPPIPSAGGPGPGVGSPLEAMHGEIRALARQVQELRMMVQQQRGGQGPALRPGDAKRGDAPGQEFRRPDGGEQRGERAQGEPRREHCGSPDAAPEHREGPGRHHGPGDGENHPRGEGKPSNPPGNPPPHADRPPGDAPVPPPAQ